jgi:hypothetical protein
MRSLTEERDKIEVYIAFGATVSLKSHLRKLTFRAAYRSLLTYSQRSPSSGLTSHNQSNVRHRPHLHPWHDERRYLGWRKRRTSCSVTDGLLSLSQAQTKLKPVPDHNVPDCQQLGSLRFSDHRSRHCASCRWAASHSAGPPCSRSNLEHLAAPNGPAWLSEGLGRTEGMSQEGPRREVVTAHSLLTTNSETLE